MAEPFLALITPLTGPPPGYWGGVAPPYPDQGLPGAPPGYWGGVAPPSPTHPIAPGGTPVPPEVWPQPPVPPLPPELESQIVVAVHKPGQDWQVQTYAVAPDQGMPKPTPH